MKTVEAAFGCTAGRQIPDSRGQPGGFAGNIARCGALWLVSAPGMDGVRCRFPGKPTDQEEALMKRGKKAARLGIDAIQEELANIEEEVTSLGKSLGGSASAEARAAMSSIRERLDRIAGEAGTMTRAGVGAVEHTVEENPFTSLAIAFGVGLVLALMVRR
jgi:ElaB/YqjD/DUF883 family membrane-anchored ribosome-binding protein